MYVHSHTARSPAVARFLSLRHATVIYHRQLRADNDRETLLQAKENSSDIGLLTWLQGIRLPITSPIETYT